MIAPKLPVLLDTDIGSDIDDAVALAYLLAQPRCELVGITTVSGEPHRRAALAHAVCLAAGREDVSVHVGLEAPLLAVPLQPRAPQAEVLPAEALTEFENRPLWTSCGRPSAPGPANSRCWRLAR